MSEQTTQALTIRDEIRILGSRKKANLGSPIQARMLANQLRTEGDKSRKRSGEDAHRDGTKLIVLYTSLAEHHFKRESFYDFVKFDLGLPRSTCNVWVRVAKYATEAQSSWGIETCLAAGRLIEFLKKHPARAREFGVKEEPETITDLARGKFPLPDGRTLRFKGETVFADDVEDVLVLLGGRGSARLSKRQRAGNERIHQELATNPVLDGVEAALARRRGRNGLKLFIPEGSDPVEIAKAIARVLVG